MAAARAKRLSRQVSCFQSGVCVLLGPGGSVSPGTREAPSLSPGKGHPVQTEEQEGTWVPDVPCASLGAFVYV